MGRKDDEFFQLIREISSGCKGRHFVWHSPNGISLDRVEIAIIATQGFLFAKIKKNSIVLGGRHNFLGFTQMCHFFLCSSQQISEFCRLYVIKIYTGGFRSNYY